MLYVAAARRPERAKGEEQERSADPENRQAQGGDHHHRVLEVRLHSAGTVAMTTRPRNLPPDIDAAIFDFDETMIDLEKQHTAACDRLCRAMGARYTDMPEDFRNASGKRVVDDVREMRDFFGWSRGLDDLLAERQHYFDNEIVASPDLELMTGVAPFVRGLHGRGLLLAITSSAVRNSIETILDRFDLLSLFAVIVDGGEVHRGKPDPEAYLITAGRLGIDPARSVVFEDSAIGVRAAKAAGMYCIAVRNPKAKIVQDLSPADAVAYSFEEIDAGWFTPSAPSGR